MGRDTEKREREREGGREKEKLRRAGEDGGPRTEDGRRNGEGGGCISFLGQRSRGREGTDFSKTSTRSVVFGLDLFLFDPFSHDPIHHRIVHVILINPHGEI